MQIENVFSNLNSELLDYLDDDLTLNHPLIYKSPLLKSEIDHVNSMLDVKQFKLDKALEESDYLLFSMLHEKPWRPVILFDLEDDNEISKKQLMEVASHTWIASENNFTYWEDWKVFFERNLKFNRFFMDSDELEIYDSFSQEITIYHGGNSDHAISWSLDKDIAEWFAGRSGEISVKVLTKTVSKNRIFAYINKRNEQEVILL